MKQNETSRDEVKASLAAPNTAMPLELIRGVCRLTLKTCVSEARKVQQSNPQHAAKIEQRAIGIVQFISTLEMTAQIMTKLPIVEPDPAAMIDTLNFITDEINNEPDPILQLINSTLASAAAERHYTEIIKKYTDGTSEF